MIIFPLIAVMLLAALCTAAGFPVDLSGLIQWVSTLIPAGFFPPGL